MPFTKEDLESSVEDLLPVELLPTAVTPPPPLTDLPRKPVTKLPLTLEFLEELPPPVDLAALAESEKPDPQDLLAQMVVTETMDNPDPMDSTDLMPHLEPNPVPTISASTVLLAPPDLPETLDPKDPTETLEPPETTEPLETLELLDKLDLPDPLDHLETLDKLDLLAHLESSTTFPAKLDLPDPLDLLDPLDLPDLLETTETLEPLDPKDPPEMPETLAKTDNPELPETVDRTEKAEPKAAAT